MKYSLFLLIFAVPLLANSQDFTPFQKIISKYVVESSLPGGGIQTAFKYEEAKKDPSTQKLINEQLSLLKNYAINDLKAKNSANAFWINSYNFFMIAIILDQGFSGTKLQINSVKDLGSFFSPYRIFKSKINNVGGKSYSLDDIEKGILLGEEFKKKGWKDARIHFAVNCASIGCPPLLKQIYTTENLDKVLTTNVQRGLKTPRHFKMKGKTLFLTHLFKWYRQDFIDSQGSVKDFLKKYLADSQVKRSVDQASGIEYIKYDWNLNRPENF